MKLIIALLYISLGLIRHASPLTMGIALVFLILALRPTGGYQKQYRNRYQRRHRWTARERILGLLTRL